MVWACLAAAVAGLVIGLRFRVPLLLFSAAILTGATIIVAIRLEWSFVHTITVVFLLLAVHQISYLIGLLAFTRR